jgi:hypothetical protein
MNLGFLADRSSVCMFEEFLHEQFAINRAVIPLSVISAVVCTHSFPGFGDHLIPVVISTADDMEKS